MHLTKLIFTISFANWLSFCWLSMCPLKFCFNLIFVRVIQIGNVGIVSLTFIPQTVCAKSCNYLSQITLLFMNIQWLYFINQPLTKSWRVPVALTCHQMQRWDVAHLRPKHLFAENHPDRSLGWSENKKNDKNNYIIESEFLTNFFENIICTGVYSYFVCLNA